MSDSGNQIPQPESAREEKPSLPARIFVVHGSNEEMKAEVAAYLNKLGFEIVFTQDKINSLKPIAQKVTENPDVRFAVVLLSGDDFVYPKNDKPANAFLKANQKVVFELGFWINHLGRDHVLALYQDQKSFRRPTEYFDVLYILFDKQGAWKKELLARVK